MTAPKRRNGVLVQTIERGCESKWRYSDEVGARAAGQRISEQLGIPLYFYPCKLCRGFHLTRKKHPKADRDVNYQFAPTPR